LNRKTDALHFLNELYEEAQADGRWGTVLQTLLLKALVNQQQNDAPSALASLRRAVELAASQGYVRLFVEEGPQMYNLLKSLLSVTEQVDQHRYIRRLFSAFPPAASANGALVEPLTTRELDVLRLMVKGGSNKVMAAQLVVTEGTIKTHVHNIIGKLGVQNRTQAVARARELGLLDFEA
jgi:LuxR family transcriptional regulator, maltose regulon positive regulatory protein